MIRARFLAFPCFALWLSAPLATAQPVFVDVQRGYGVHAWGVGTRVSGEEGLWHSGGWRLDRDWRLRVSRWTSFHGNAHSLWDAAVFPALRLAPANEGAFVPYAEAGIGFHLVSRNRIGDRGLGMAFQFGEHVALGARFGSRLAWSLALRAEHVSNAHLKLPNDGATFFGTELQYAW